MLCPASGPGRRVVKSRSQLPRQLQSTRLPSRSRSQQTVQDRLRLSFRELWSKTQVSDTQCLLPFTLPWTRRRGCECEAHSCFNLVSV